jgi:hypothetical protein
MGDEASVGYAPETTELPLYTGGNTVEAYRGPVAYPIEVPFVGT